MFTAALQTFLVQTGDAALVSLSIAAAMSVAPQLINAPSTAPTAIPSANFADGGKDHAILLSTGAIIGIAAGGFVGVVLLVAAIWMHISQRKQIFSVADEVTGASSISVSQVGNNTSGATGSEGKVSMVISTEQAV